MKNIFNNKAWARKSVLILALLLGASLFAYKMGLFKGWQQAKVDQVIHISCPDLQQGCQFKINEQSYQIKSAAPVSTDQPVTLTLTGPAKSVYLNWQMVDMDMGSNRYKMQDIGKDQWQAETALPICSQKRQDWLLSLQLEQVEVRIQTTSHGKS